MAKGLYREENGWANQDSVRVQFEDGKELDIPRSLYEAEGYQPPFQSLPTKQDYEQSDA